MTEPVSHRMTTVYVQVPGQPPVSVGVCAGFDYTYEGHVDGVSDGVDATWELTILDPNPELLTSLGWTFLDEEQPTPAAGPPTTEIDPAEIRAALPQGGSHALVTENVTAS